MLSGDFSQWQSQIQSAAPASFWVHVLIAVCIALVAAYYAYLFFRRARIIEDTPTSKIRSAAQGYVELNGRGRLMEGPDIIAPYSGKTCTWYRYRVERVSDKHSHTIDSGTSEELFVLEGQTGRCVIDPDGAHVTPTSKNVWYDSTHPPRRLSRSSSFMSRLGGRYRYVEERMHPGDPLYAIGWFKSVGGRNESFNTREEVRALIAKWKSNPEFMTKNFDHNGDGKIDMQEFETVRKAAERFVKKSQAKRSVAPPTHVMTKAVDRNHPFLLSSIPQHKLTKRFKWYTGGLFVVCISAGTFVVWLLNVRF